MTTRWREIRSLFETVRDLPEEQRRSWLLKEAGEDSELCDSVTRLLDADAVAGEFLSQPAVSSLFGRQRRCDDDDVLNTDDRLGPFRVIRKIGHGGVSVVYLAERCDGVFEQQVAVKVIKRGMDTDSVIARFHSERQILAALDHPFIAHILDGGSTQEGLPYFVMEYVEGEILTEYLRRHELSIRERLELFVRIGSAVAYAHRRQVVHRDLKPANIVVNADGNPKLLDFGLAKVLSTGSDDELQTVAADRMLTPAYASPEQIAGAPVTPASDVFSLGVVLHEMLIGSRPPADGAAVALLPTADPESPKDLTSIVRMALRQEPERRYRSADQLREDVERHLMGLPVEARHGTVGDRVKRFMRRHRSGLAASLAVSVCLAVSGGAVIWQREIAKLEHTRAERRYNELRELANSMLLEFDDAIVDMPGAPPVRQALVTSALSHLIALEPESAGDPMLQREIAYAYLRLADVQRQSYGLGGGNAAGALENLNRALLIMQSLVVLPEATAHDLETLARCHHRIALTLRQTGDWQGDLEHARRAVEIHREIVSGEPGSSTAQEALADALQTMGVALYRAADAPATLETFERVVWLRKKLLEAAPSNEGTRADLAAALRNLGLGLEMVGELEASLHAYESSLSQVQDLIERNPASVRLRSDLMRSYQLLGNSLCAIGRAEEGLRHLRTGNGLGQDLQRVDPNNAAIRRRLVQSHRDLGLALINAGMRDEAVEILTQAVELLGPWMRDSKANAQVRVLLAEVTRALGRASEPGDTDDTQPEQWRYALASYRQSLELWHRLEMDGLLAPIHAQKPVRLSEAIRRCEEAVESR